MKKLIFLAPTLIVGAGKNHQDGRGVSQPTRRPIPPVPCEHSSAPFIGYTYKPFLYKTERQAWDGDPPDTLPYIVGVGESPSGLLDTTLATFPKGFAPGMLVTISGEHTVTLHRLQPAGTSLRGDREVFLRGGQNFRPVALTAAPDGTVYLTDWVLSGYPNHGRAVFGK